MKNKVSIEKLGTVGVFLIAIFSPCCFPLFAFALSALGLGSFELFGGWTMWLFQAMVVLSLVGFYLSYRKNKYLLPLLIGILSAVAIVSSYALVESGYQTFLLYSGMFGLLIATGANYFRNKKQPACDTCGIYNGQKVELNSTLTCPNCGFKKAETMPTDACQYFYECQNCKQVLKPKQGDCCVYCSYGSVKCPPIQAGENCC